MRSLFDPIRLGAIQAPNRVLMAPLTRGRSTRDHVPTPIMATYYTQRASAGLIITEATGISQEGLGWPNAPGLWTEAQVEGWKPVTEAVHQAGGRIMAQLWHMGRLVHPSFSDGAPPVSASATTAPGEAHTNDGKQPNAAARALPKDEIPRVIGDYVRAAANAMRAGFDGVQIHGANGYLIDQFLRDAANHRDDEYGGSPENRTRFMNEVVRAVANEVGADRTAIRLSPNGTTQGVKDSDPSTVFALAAEKLSDIGIAFLELREPGEDGSFGRTLQPKQSPVIRPAFDGPLVLNSDYGFENGQTALDSGIADAIAFGRTFLANPDLPHRLANNIELNPDDMATWYSPGEKGYVDYPFAAREAEAAG